MRSEHAQVQTLERVQPTSFDMQCFFHRTGWSDIPGAPQHAHRHSHGQTWTVISHTSSALYPSILRVYTRGRTARIKTLPTLVSLPPTSLTLGGVETRPPHRALNSIYSILPFSLSFITRFLSLFYPFHLHIDCIFN